MVRYNRVQSTVNLPPTEEVSANLYYIPELRSVLGTYLLDLIDDDFGVAHDALVFESVLLTRNDCYSRTKCTKLFLRIATGLHLPNIIFAAHL